MAITTRYSQNVAVEQTPFANFPGGGPIAGPAGAQLNDSGFEIGSVKEITAIYQMYGNEAASDIINIALLQPGDMVDPAGCKVVTTGIATTATINVGDDDTQGYGIIASGVAFGAAVPTTGLQGADPSRYGSAINVATGQTNPVGFGANGEALVDPHIIGVLATEQAASGGGTGTGVAGSWLQAQFATLGTPVGGKCLIFKIKVIRP